MNHLDEVHGVDALPISGQGLIHRNLRATSRKHQTYGDAATIGRCNRALF